jgi:uncharacterized protein
MNANDRDELFIEADRLSDLGDHKEALGIFVKLAENGNQHAMSRLAIIYCEGIGVEKNIEESIKWDLRAIDGGDIVAMSNLALTYCSLREFRQGRYWFERAVEAGYGDAAVELAKLLHVSDFEKVNVKKLLRLAINSQLITPGAVEEAVTLLYQLET